ncbi:MAG: hypothetical protein A2X86_13765 [Bdellovibrionales bacterium GWA2_49_15]|nr:MAG: hypothetical protein A2X86_13765 [Bdellovibrionales bacterium GWA2_49_15]HAZ13594.1 hypothetical protein [Bdellovibrionales bacterium]
MKPLKDLFLISVLSIVLMECTNVQKQELEADKAKIEVSAEEDISIRIDTMIKEAKWPTEEQKTRLFGLKEKTKNKIVEINIKLKKAKIVLVQHLVVKDSTNEKLRLLKKDIKKLYNQKVDVMLDAIEEARKILGKLDHVTQLDSMYHLYLLNEY